MAKSEIDKVRDAIDTVTHGDFEIYDGIQGDLTFQLRVENFKPVIEMLVTNMGCRHLSGITAQIHPDHPNTIEVMYHFWMGSGFSLMILLPKELPQISEIFSLLPGADFYEREVAEMFGIKFLGREEMPPLLLPDEWDQGPPFIKKEEKDE